MDLIAFFSLFGSPASYVGYIGIGAGLYKVYNRIVETQLYAKKANHNSTVLLKALIKRGLLDDEDLKEYEFNNG